MNALNLLPWRFRRKLLLRVRIAQWSVVAALACGGVLAAAGVQYARIARREQTLSRLEARCASLNDMRAETTRIRGRVAESQRLQSLLSRVENQELPIQAVGLVSRAVQSADGKLELKAVTLARTQITIPRPDKAAPPKKEELVSLALDGRARDNLAIADLVLRLRETGVFDAVHLKPAHADLAGQRPFLVECTYQTGSSP